MQPPTIRIVRIITRLNIGGPTIQAAVLSTQLDPRRFSTCLVVGASEAGEGDAGEAVQRQGARIIRLASLRRAIHPWADVVTLGRLLRLLWRERPQIIHTHMAKAGTLGRLAAWLYNTCGPGRAPGARAVVIHTFHGHVLDGYFAPWMARIFLAIERWMGRHTDCLVAVSRTIRDALLAKGIGRAGQWRVVPLGLDLSALAQLAPPPSMSGGASTVRYGLTGRLVPIKNPGLFLEALAQTIREQPTNRITGLVVGDGPLRGELEAQARRLGLSNAVQFTGWRHDLPDVYAGVDVACLTSWNEGTPVALIEAMAAARPVVATAVGGVGDLLEEAGQAPAPIAPGAFRRTDRGLLVNPGDAGGFAAALQAVAADGELCRELGRAGRAFVLERFTQHRLVRDITTLYEALLKRR